MTEKVRVVKLEMGKQVCIWDNIQAALDELEVFWDDGDVGVDLALSIELMPKADFDDLPEFEGW